MRPLILALALVTAPLSAKADTGRLTEMLRMIPDAAIPSGAPRLDIAYGNGDAVRNIARNGNQAWPADDWAHEYAAMRAAPPAQATALAAGDGEVMSLGYRDWVHALEVSAPPARMGLNSLFPDSEMRLRGALFGRGMEVATRNQTMVLWQGREDHARVAERADPENPFGGAEGLSARFVVDPEWAYWASGWQQLEWMLAGGSPTLADRGGVAQLVSGVERSMPRYGQLVSFRASLDLSGQGLDDWADLPVLGVFVADAVQRREETGLIGFLFAPGTDTEAVAQRVRERWRGSMLARWSEEPDLVGMAGRLPGLVLRIGGGWGPDEAASNDALASLMRARQNGTLTALIAP
jgi:hypothetical protein